MEMFGSTFGFLFGLIAACASGFLLLAVMDFVVTYINIKKRGIK